MHLDLGKRKPSLRREVPAIGAVRLARLSPEQCAKLFSASLQILDRTGVRVFDEEALALLSRGGAPLSDGNRVRLPSRLVEWALTVAPRQVTLFDRDGRPAMPVAGRACFFGPGSDCLYIRDHRTGERRRPLLQDVVEAARLVDALPNIDFAMSMFLPVDVPQTVLDRFQMEAMLHNTSKPILFVTPDFGGCIDAVEMAEAVVGGADALERHPLVACYINVTTGLVHNQDAIQKLLFLAGRGLPTTYIPSTQGGATAPVTPAAALAVAQAGALVGLVLSQLRREGAPFIMPGWGGNMLDMRTTVQPYADPDKRSLAIDLVHHVGLPMFSLAGCSDSKLLDEQAGIEAALTLMTDVLGGGHIVHDLGYLESGMCGSLAQLAICNEILAWLGHYVRDVDLSDEALALDLIDEIGPDGVYLESNHTLRRFRERWYPSLFDRDNFAGWESRGSLSLPERAAAQVEDILSSHAPAPLPGEVAARVRGVVERARARAGE